MFAEVLKNLREQNKIYQKDFAEAISVSKSTVAMWETGKRTPDTETLKKIAQFFDVSLDYLLDNPSNDDNKEEINNPDIRMIARAGKKMTNEQAEQIRKYAEYMFPEAFK